jgi:hypothetical protein
VNDEQERISNKVLVVQFKVLSRHLPLRTEENQEKPQSVDVGR